MKVLENENSIFFDIDNTIIFWKPKSTKKHPKSFDVDYYGDKVNVYPHIEHLSLLKSSLVRGRTVILWSSNGWLWTKNVLNGLISKNYLKDSNNIIVMSKPCIYVDDLNCEEWMGHRIFLKTQGNPYEK